MCMLSYNAPECAILRYNSGNDNIPVKHKKPAKRIL